MDCTTKDAIYGTSKNLDAVSPPNVSMRPSPHIAFDLQGTRTPTSMNELLPQVLPIFSELPQPLLSYTVLGVYEFERLPSNDTTLEANVVQCLVVNGVLTLGRGNLPERCKGPHIA